jgi:hypothetical protein
MPDLSPRGRIVRDAIIYTPLFLISLLALALMVAGVWDRAPVAMVLLVVVGFLFGYQSIQSLRDLSSQPHETTGAVARRWTKRDAFVAKSHYITVEKAIFRIPVESYLDVRQGDTVTVVAYPHTGTVVSVTRAPREEAEEPPPQPQAVESSARMRTLRTARATPSARERRSRETPPRPEEPPAPPSERTP